MTLRIRTVALDDDRPLLELAPDRPDVVAWVRDGDGMVGWGEAVRIEPGVGGGRFDTAATGVTALLDTASVDDEIGLPATSGLAIGSFTFDEHTPGSMMVVPRVVVGRHDGVTWRTTIDPDRAAPMPPADERPRAAPRRDRPRYAGASIPDLHWLEAVAQAVDLIDRGRIDKVVLARDHALWSREVFDPVDVAIRLTRTFPSCYTFIAQGLVGATPELLVAREASTITSRVLAGTTARASDPASDTRLGEQLLASDKDRWEHELAVESVRVVLEDVCDDLVCGATPQLLVLDNLQHLATDFTGR